MPMNARLLRPLASGFDLRRLSGLVQWYDAADQSTMTLNGTTVSEWRSKVGGVAVSQATAAAQPTLTTNYYNGRSALTFDGGDVLYNASLPIQIDGMTVAVVFEETTRVAFAGLVVGTPASGNDSNSAGAFINVVHNGSNRPSELFSSVANNIDLRSPLISETTALGKRVTVARVAPSAGGFGQADFRYDGQAGTADTLYAAQTNSTGTLIGGRYQSGAVSNLYRFNGRILEVAIWDRDLTADETARAEGYLAWKWGLQSQLPYDHPYAASFPGFGSQATPTDADTLTYLAAVAAADGTGVEVGVANAVESFITGCKEDGIWDSIKASCILAGARTLAGALVPLVGTAPTNNNFAEADYNRETGLVGDGSTTYLDSNRANDADPQDDNHNAVWVATADSQVNARSYLDGGGTSSGANNIGRSGTVTELFIRSRCATAANPAAGTATGLIGTSRSGAAAYTLRVSGANSTVTQASQTPDTSNIDVYSRAGSLVTDARLAFYSIGESLDLAALDARVTALITAIGAAI